MRFYFAARTVKEYEILVNDLKWNDVAGDRTLTGDGLNIADTQVFPLHSPLNVRPNVPDVVVILTDGEPRGRKRGRQLQMALHHSSSMKNRSILIIGIAVGQPAIRKKFSHILLQLVTSNKTKFDTDFIDLDKILDQLVDVSCTPFKPGDCVCPTIQSVDLYIKPSKTTREVSWVQPNLKCKNGRIPKFVNTTVSPNIVSPHNFPAGNHDIVYTYTFKGGFALKCFVKISVKSCKCQSLPPVIAYAPRGGSVPVHWVAPVPSCGYTLTATHPNTPSGSTFNIGTHTVNYVYSTVAGFILTCGINIDVRECFCKNTNVDIYVHPEKRTRIVNWEEPKPNCPGLRIVRTKVEPAMTPGASLGIGRHLIKYSYVMSNGVSLQCSASVMIKVIPCQGQDYNPATQLCCCGKLHILKVGFKCCGRRRYDSKTTKCCPVGFNIVKNNETCPEAK
ncbi:uncharacterized protein LOC114526951 [Dendronephthya gigantea]|uniref:uncharacterized protein LOC114526951 n=1 Tax=Dendronephthya gigantea TaxID=151771 RepID=UPI00106B3652|nr:uncharacterized protein LOC114526951 [Dendronephthya gigantea]